MQSRYLKFAVISLFGAWGTLFLICVAGYLRWDNRLLWLPPVFMTISFFFAIASREYEERHLPLILTALLAFASLPIYITAYIFLFLYSIPAG